MNPDPASHNIAQRFALMQKILFRTCTADADETFVLSLCPALSPARVRDGVTPMFSLLVHIFIHKWQGNGQ